MDTILDGYQQFFEYVKKDDFFSFGLKNIITLDKTIVSVLWKKLLDDINNQSQKLFIRSFGKNGNGNSSFKNLYMAVFGIDIKFDPSNNDKPTQIMKKNSIYKKNKNIFNYQVSHVFGNTKNVYSFTAPWNIVYIPKIIDPFTGHEAKREYIDEFKKLFQGHIIQKFPNEINEYNQIMKIKYFEIKEWVDANIPDKKRNDILKEFKEIDLV